MGSEIAVVAASDAVVVGSVAVGLAVVAKAAVEKDPVHLAVDSVVAAVAVLLAVGSAVVDWAVETGGLAAAGEVGVVAAGLAEGEAEVGVVGVVALA